MTRDKALEGFRASLAGESPPPGLAGPLAALWHLAKDQWDTAHRIAQDSPGRYGAWVHAHLHRVEGDPANAAYWYRRAGRPVSTKPLPEEWDEIAAALLSAEDGASG